MRINACVKITKPTIHSKRMPCDLCPLVMDDGISGLKMPRLHTPVKWHKFAVIGYHEFNKSIS
jgi:hypothetical protein